jgi:hypothetical protein
MPTTREDIQGWLREAKERGATYLVVMCDTFDWEDYPVYVMPGEDPNELRKSANMQKAMECYDLSLDLDMQLDERPAHHWGPAR